MHGMEALTVIEDEVQAGVHGAQPWMFGLV
jgi:hypothetical protein